MTMAVAWWVHTTGYKFGYHHIGSEGLLKISTDHENWTLINSSC